MFNFWQRFLRFIKGKQNVEIQDMVWLKSWGRGITVVRLVEKEENDD